MSFLEYQHTVDKRKSADLHNLLAARDFVITCIKSTNAPGEEELREDLDLIEQLRDGVILCRLVNCVKPNTIRVIHKQKLHYRMMDNINRFVEVCRTLGVDENQLFSPLELIRKTDGIQYKVVKCILVLKEYKETGKIEHPKQDRLRTPIPPKPVGLPSLAHANSVGNHAPDFSAPRGVHQPPQVLHHPVYVPPHTTESHGNTPVHTPQSAGDVVQGTNSLHSSLSSSSKETPKASPKPDEEPLEKVAQQKTIDIKAMSPVIRRMTNKENTLKDSIELSVEDNNDNDDDWDTDADYVNTSFMGKLPSEIQVRPAEIEEYEEDIPSHRVAFGVVRGRCLDEGCSCTEYHGAMDQGGPCQNCGHYPAKHEEVGRDESREISREIAAFLIKPEMLEYHFKIGEGSFGEVFKGALWGKDIAIKKVKGLKLNPHQRLEFLKEIKIMASLRHPNVILWIGACLDPPIIVTELLERGSLTDVLQQNGEEIGWLVRLKMALDMCLGVCYLHNLDLVHQDLKTSNLLVDEYYNVKVGDFGLSHFIRTTPQGDSETGKGGTASYMAPELLVTGGRGGTKMSDVFSLGVILWEIATGHRIFDGKEDTFSIIHHVVEMKERPPILDTIPSDFAELIQWCWQEDPTARPRVEDMISSLRKIIGSLRITKKDVGPKPMVEIGPTGPRSM